MIEACNGLAQRGIRVRLVAYSLTGVLPEWLPWQLYQPDR